MLVIDASVVLEWLLSDARATEAEAILVRAASEDVWAPALFWLEVGNVLQMRLRRKLIDEAFRDTAIGRLRVLGLHTEGGEDLATSALDRTLALADRFGLMTYDASYLELALRLGASLGSFDKALCAAAKSAGVPVLGGAAPNA